MEKTTISGKQAIYMMVSFIVGSSTLLGTAPGAKQDAWICLISALVLSIPLYLMFARIIKLFPGQDIYQILYSVFGKIGGTIFTIIFLLFSLQLGSIVTRNFTEFISIVSLDRTPQLIIGAFILFVCCYILKKGVEVLGRLSVFFTIVLFFLLFLTFFLLTKDMNPNYLKPIMELDMNTFFKSTISTLLFPFADGIVLMAVLSNIRKKDSPYKVVVTGVILAGVFLLVAVFRNLMTLGAPTLELLYFPSYSTVSTINIGNFISRLEILLTINFIFAGIVKICVCLYSASKGISKLFHIDNSKILLAPFALFMLGISAALYKNTMQMMEFNKNSAPYFILLQIIFPAVIWIGAEIKVRKMKKIAKPTIQ